MHRNQLKNTWLTGILTVIPLAITIWLMVWLFNWMTGAIPPILEQTVFKFSPIGNELRNSRSFEYAMRFVGLLIIIVGIYFVGLITRLVLIKQLLGILEGVMERLPMIGTIYSSIRQIGNAILRGGGTGMFRQVALIEYPRQGSYVIGFVTSSGAQELENKTENKLTSIFVPTTPNPTSGFLLMLPTDDVTILDMTVAEGMRLVISGGAVHPNQRPENGKNGRQKLEAGGNGEQA